MAGLTKKDFLKKLLEKIAPVREPAEGILLLLEDGLLDEELVENLIGVVQSGVAAAREENQQKILEKSQDFLTALKNQEKKEAVDEAELENLLGQIE